MMNQDQMRAAAMQQAVDRAKREGVRCTVYVEKTQRGNVWYVRTDVEGVPPNGEIVWREPAPKYDPSCADHTCGKCEPCYTEYVAAKMNGELD